MNVPLPTTLTIRPRSRSKRMARRTVMYPTPISAARSVVGAFLPVIAVVFYLAVSVLFIIEPLRRIRIRTRRTTQPE
jgi:hypothetical protein